MKKLLTTLLLAMLLFAAFTPLANAGEQEAFDGEFVHHEGKSYKGDMDWSYFFRDTDSNGVDDLIDQSEDEKVDIFIKTESLPTNEDVELLENFVPAVYYKAKYTNTILIHQVQKDLIYQKLRYLDRVDFVEFAPEAKPFLANSVPSMKVKPNDLYRDVWDELGITGLGVNVAVLDGGSNDNEIAADMAHESLDDMDDDPLTYDPKFIAGWDWELLAGGELVDPHGDPLIGHGTHVSGTILGTGGQGVDSDNRGVAPGAQLIDVKVVTDIGAGGILIPAMEWCIDNVDRDWTTSENDGIQIMSMSLGGGESDGSDAMSQTANQCVDAGMVVVVATGNDGQTGYISTPAAADKVVAVGAADDKNTLTRSDETVAGFSNRGPRNDDGDSDPYDELKPDVVAPGVQVMAPRVDSYNVYINMDGTSMATPHVSGVVALMLEANPDLTPPQVKKILQQSAEARGTPYNTDLSDKYNGAWGYGLTDAYKAVIMAQGYCDLEVDELEVTNIEAGKNRFDEGDEAEIKVTINELENLVDVNSFKLDIKDAEAGTTVKTFNGNIRAGESKEYTTTVQMINGGTYHIKGETSDADPQDLNPDNDEKTVSVYVNYLPHSDVTANETEPMTQDEVRFQGTNSNDPDGTITSYRFIFGDGEETGWQDEPVATHTYMEDGSFETRLIVRDNESAESGPYTDTSRITVYNRAPMVNPGEDLTGEVDVEVEFKGTAKDKDGEVELYEWDFDGDGDYDWSSSSTGEATHKYEEPGEYRAKFRATDDDDTSDTETINVDISGSTENIPPVARITDPEDKEVYFTDKELHLDGGSSYDSDGSISSYSWRSNISGLLYDGVQKENDVVVNDGGHHNISLTVEDDQEGTDLTWVHIFIDAPPVVFIDSPNDGELYTQTEIFFDAGSSSDKDGDTLIYKWTSDVDGVLYEGEESSFSKEMNAGKHVILLEVSDPYITKSKSVEIEIEESSNNRPRAVINDPLADIVYSTEEKIFFNATESNDPDEDSLTFTWTSDKDGELYQGMEPSFQKKLKSGTHQITLKVSDKESSDEATVELVVNTPPEAIIATPSDGSSYFIGNTVQFDASGSYDPDGDSGSLSYTWLVNEEEVATGINFESHFEKGAKDITLIVEDEYGFTSQDTALIFIVSHNVATSFRSYESRTIAADPGEKLTVTFVVENKAPITDHIELQEIQGADSILTIQGEKDFSIDPGESTDVTFEIAVSDSAEEGRDELGFSIITGTGDYAEEVQDTLAVLIGGVLSFDITFDKTNVKIDAGTSASVKVTLVNNGNSNAGFKISVEEPKNWDIKLSSSIFTISQGEEKTITVTITAPQTIKQANQTVDFIFESGDFKETVPLSITAGDMGSAPSTDDGDDSPGFATGFMVLALVGVVLISSRKRRT